MLLFFALLSVFYFQKSFEYLKKPSSRDSFLLTSAAIVAFLALLVIGLFDYVWYNYRIMFLFWAVIGIGVACIRVGRKEISRLEVYDDINEQSGAIDVEI